MTTVKRHFFENHYISFVKQDEIVHLHHGVDNVLRDEIIKEESRLCDERPTKHDIRIVSVQRLSLDEIEKELANTDITVCGECTARFASLDEGGSETLCLEDEAASLLKNKSLASALSRDLKFAVGLLESIENLQK